MKRRLLLLGLCLFVNHLSMAQLFSEDFENVTAPALPTGWTQITPASDGGFLTGTDQSSVFFAIPPHTQYLATNDDACTCDKSLEQLFSPQITIPATGSFTLTFDFIQGQVAPNESGSIGITTDGGTTITELQELNGQNVTVNGAIWENTFISIPAAYAGQTVQLVWTYTDGGYGTGMVLDNIVVFENSPINMEMVSINLVEIVEPGNVTITGTIRNLGTDPVTSVDIIWDAGQGPITETVAVNMVYTDIYDFSHSTPLVASPASTYTVDVAVGITGDAELSNNSLQHTMRTVSSVVPKVVVVEEKTGEWCGYCVRGAVGLAEMQLSNPDDYIGIAIHYGDHMEVPSYDMPFQSILPGGYPMVTVDRVLDGDPSDLSALHPERKSTSVAPAKINASGTYNGTDVIVDISADFVIDLDGEYRLVAVLVEDSVLGIEQSNKYNDGSEGPMQMPNIGSMPNFDYVGAGDPITSTYYHDHVARALGDEEIEGTAGSLPATVADNSTHSYMYTIPQDTAWNMSNMHVVGMLIDINTGEILNAGKGNLVYLDVTGLSNNSIVNHGIDLFPNPASSITSLRFSISNSDDVKVQVQDLSGNVVSLKEYGVLPSGEHELQTDVSELSSGVYYLTVLSGDDSQTIKLVKN